MSRAATREWALGDIRDDTARGFEQIYGRQAHGLWSAPGALRLIGDHTEYADGHTLCVALDRRTVVALAVRGDRKIRIASTDQDELAEITLDDLDPDTLHGWPQYPLGVAWALGQLGLDLAGVPGLDLFIESDVPVGVRMGSSVALCSAIALALSDAWRFRADRYTLARACSRSESIAHGEDVGLGPALAALTGAVDSGVLFDGRSRDFDRVPLRFADSNYQMLVIVTEATPVTHPPLQERLASLEAVEDALSIKSLRELSVADLGKLSKLKGLPSGAADLVRHVVRENQRVLDTARTLREEGPEGVGQLLLDSHQSLADAFGPHPREIGLALDTALEHGAVGGRLLGHHESSSVLALAPEDSISRINQALDAIFSEHGLTPPDLYITSASEQATRH